MNTTHYAIARIGDDGGYFLGTVAYTEADAWLLFAAKYPHENKESAKVFRSHYDTSDLARLLATPSERQKVMVGTAHLRLP